MKTYKITYGTSRGRDTYGYYIVTITNLDTGKRYIANGGGYDMLGAALGDMLSAEYQNSLMKLRGRSNYTYDGKTRKPNKKGLYGLTYCTKKSKYAGMMTIDGACGQSSVEKIAKAAGINMSLVWDRGVPGLGKYVSVVIE